MLVTCAQAGGHLARHVQRTGHRPWENVTVIAGAEPLLPGDRQARAGAFGPFRVEVVAGLPSTAAGKHRLVVVEP